MNWLPKLPIDCSPNPLADGRTQGESNALAALRCIHRVGGWITAPLLGTACWPESQWPRKRAEVLIRRMVGMDLLQRRGHSPNSVYVITAAAEEWAAHRGLLVERGTHYGRVRRDGRWEPPSSFEHDHRAVEFLQYEFMSGAAEYVTEAEIARMNRDLAKRPDGLLPWFGTEYWTWVEVESARKTGAAARALAESIVRICRGAGPRVTLPDGRVVTPSRVQIVVAGTVDERGYALDHQRRIIASIRRLHIIDQIQVEFVYASRGFIDRETVTIGPA